MWQCELNSYGTVKHTVVHFYEHSPQASHDRWVPVTTAWHILWLWTEE